MPADMEMAHRSTQLIHQYNSRSYQVTFVGAGKDWARVRLRGLGVRLGLEVEGPAPDKLWNCKAVLEVSAADSLLPPAYARAHSHFLHKFTDFLNGL